MNPFIRLTQALCLCLFILSASSAQATIVQFQTVMGDFEVNLYDEGAPKTVENFLNYIESEAYNDSFFHRSVPGFIVQGGGYRYDLDAEEAKSIKKNEPVANEPAYSNRRGTIAMAKLGNRPDSATNQWFFNLDDNQENLDVQNGGFTVFGEVIGDGMEVVDAIAALPRFTFGGAFGDLPLRNFTDDDFEQEVQPSEDHFVIVRSVQVLDASIDTAEDLDPAPNTLIEQKDNSSSGSGSTGGLSLLLLVVAGLALWRRKLRDAKKLTSWH